MTRRDYLRLAYALARANPGDGASLPERSLWGATCGIVGCEIARRNPAFDLALFLENCGIEREPARSVALLNARLNDAESHRNNAAPQQNAPQQFVTDEIIKR